MAGDVTSTVNTERSLNSFWKIKYAPKIKEIIPEDAKVFGKAPFRKAQKVGEEYVLPVVVSLPQGATYAASGAGAFDLEDGMPSESVVARIRGNQFVMRDYMDYESAQKGVQGEESFINSTRYMVRMMQKGTYRRQETSGLYGQDNNGLGVIGDLLAYTVAIGGLVRTGGTTVTFTISSVPQPVLTAVGVTFSLSPGEADFAAGTKTVATLTTTFNESTGLYTQVVTYTEAGANVASTVQQTVTPLTYSIVEDGVTLNLRTLTITKPEWASGIWTGMRRAGLDIYLPVAGVPTTRRNTNDVARIYSIDVDNRRLTLYGNTTDLNSIAVSDVLTFRNAWGKEMLGLVAAARYRGVGTLWSVNGAKYELWRPSQFDLGAGPVTKSKIDKLIARMISRGLDEDVELVVGVNAWNDLAAEFETKRQVDASYSSSIQRAGQLKIEYLGQSGKITVVPHRMMKEGLILAYCPSYLMKVGVCDVTYGRPNPNGENATEDVNVFREMTDKAGFEIRNYWNLAAFYEMPACLGLGYNGLPTGL